MTGKTIVIGSNGLVGSSLMKYLGDAIGTWHTNKDNLQFDRSYEYLDICEKEAVNTFFEKYRPKKVFIAAAEPNVDACENPLTDKVNIYGVSSIISNCIVYHSQVIFFSSPYVFNGESQTPYKPHDETNPINRYGRQKEDIEKILKSREELAWLIIRTVGVFGDDRKNFASRVKYALAGNKKIQVPCDQTMNPIHAMDLTKTAIHLSDRYAGETFHVAGNKCMSKFDWAIKLAYELGFEHPHKTISGVKTENMNQFAMRPKNGCLDCKSLEAKAIPTPSFAKGLMRFVASP